MKSHKIASLVGIALLSATSVYAQSEAEVSNIVIPSFSVTLSGSAPQAQTKTATFSQEYPEVNEVVFDLSGSFSVIRQGKVVGTVVLTVGDTSVIRSFSNPDLTVVVPSVGGRQRIVVTVTLNAFVGLGQATQTVTTGVLTVR